MGLEKNVYLGMYLKLKSKKVTITETIRVKPNGNRAKTRFNPETGEEYSTKVVNRVETKHVNLWDIEVDGFSEDEFCTTGEIENIWMPNYDSDNLIDDDMEGEVDLSDLVIKEIKDNFITKYSKYLEEVKKHGDVEVIFGSVIYWN